MTQTINKSIQDTLIVTATLGDRSSISRTIESVRRIGGDRVRHIIITPQRNFDALKEAYPNSEIIVEPENCRGIYGSLNFALRAYGRSYKHLGFINDDDYWLDDFQLLFDVMDKSVDVDVVYGKVKYVNAENLIIGEQTSSPRYKSFGKLLKMKIVLFTQQATLMRSSLFFNLGGFDQSFKLIADSNFWLKAVQMNSKFFYINSFCAAYTIQAEQLSSNKTLQSSEHDSLINQVYPTSKFNLLYEYILFRMYNSNVYLHRILKFNKLKPASNK